MPVAQSSRAFGYFLVAIALIASAIALFFGYYGTKLVYLAVRFGSGGTLGHGAEIILGILSYLSVVTAAVLFPLIAVVAGAVALLCWTAALRRLNPSP